MTDLELAWILADTMLGSFSGSNPIKTAVVVIQKDPRVVDSQANAPESDAADDATQNLNPVAQD